MVNNLVTKAKITPSNYNPTIPTIWVDSKAEADKVGASLINEGFNVSGSPVANRAMELAIKETANMAMAKGGFYPTGSQEATRAMDLAKQETAANINNYFSTPNQIPPSVSEPSSEGSFTGYMPYILGGLALFAILQK